MDPLFDDFCWSTAAANLPSVNSTMYDINVRIPYYLSTNKFNVYVINNINLSKIE